MLRTQDKRLWIARRMEDVIGPPRPVHFDAKQTSWAAPYAPVQLTAGSPGGTKGGYTTLIPSLDFDVYEMWVWFQGVSIASNQTGVLVDLALGAAASEVDFVTSLNAGFANNAGNGQSYRFPIFLPAGSRLSGACRAANSGDTVDMFVLAYGRPSRPVWAGRRITTYGAITASSRGTNFTMGTSNAEGSWTELVAATTEEHQFFAVGFGGAGDASHIGAGGVADIGIGAGGSEVAIAENFQVSINNAEVLRYDVPAMIPRRVPAGTRMVVRGAYNNASAQAFDAILYGVS
jgi:hypothetical protein